MKRLPLLMKRLFTTIFTLLCLLALLLVGQVGAPRAHAATLFWSSDFETGNLSAFGGVHTGMPTWGNSSATVLHQGGTVTGLNGDGPWMAPAPHNGSYAAGLLVDGPSTSVGSAGGQRSELTSGHFDSVNTERWYGLSVYIPSTPNKDGSGNALTQNNAIWEIGWGTGLSLKTSGYNDATGDYSSFQIADDANPIDGWSAAWYHISPITFDSWQDFTIHVLWETDSTGYFEVYQNGQLVTLSLLNHSWTGTRATGPTYGVANQMDSEYDWYRDTQDYPNLLYLDDLKIGDTYDIVQPSSTATSTPTSTSTPTATPSPTAIATPTPLPGVYPGSIKHAFVIMMENHDWSTIKGATDAPYINSLLTRSDASYASNYHNVLSTEAGGNLHPSEPNYIWTEAGTNTFSDHTFTSDDNASSANYTADTAHITHNLSSWSGYMESKPSGVCPISSSGQYAAKHDPFVFFADVSGNPPSSSNANCQTHVKDYSALSSDITNNTLSSYSYIVPNLCDDMHDSCSPTNDPVEQGDNWLSSNLPTILNSSQYRNDGAVFITWDEDSSESNNAIGMIVLSPYAKGNGYTNSINYSHTSLVKTVQNIFGLPAVGNSVNASPPDLSDLFSSIGLKNGSFENTGTSWLSPWFINQSIRRSSTTRDGSTFVDGTHSANNYMPTAGANDSAYRLIQTGQYIRQGQTYTIIFWLKADVARTVRARMGQSVSPGSLYGSDTVNVTTAWQKFTWTFTSSVTDSNAQFSLNMGNAAGHVWVDAVSIG